MIERIAYIDDAVRAPRELTDERDAIAHLLG